MIDSVLTRARYAALVLLCWLPMAVVSAQTEPDQTDGELDPIPIKGGLGVGIAVARFETNVKYTDKESGRSVFVDATGTLGLPKVDEFPFIFGGYRFSSKHAIDFAFFRVDRQSDFIAFDENLDDINVTGTATFSDKTEFYNINYGYSLYQDERSLIQGLLGLNGLNIKYVLDAEGTITIDDQTEVTTYSDSVNVAAPLPLIGFNFWYSFTPRWSLSTKVKFVGGKYQDVRAWVASTAITARYQFNKRVGGMLGLSYFDADVTVDESDQRADVTYGYDALDLGLYFSF